MMTILGALLPIFLIIGLGAAIKRINIVPDTAWVGMERITYFIFFPAFLFRALADAHFGGFHVWPLAFTLLSGIIAMAIIMMVIRKPLGITGQEYSSVFQGGVRWNAFVAVAVLQGLFGEVGTTLAAVAFAAMVPLVNTLCVTVLTRHASPGTSRAMVVKSVARNPLVLACAAGIAAQVVSLQVPGPIDMTLKLLADASVTLGLFTVGAGLDFGSLKDHPRLLGVAGVLKLFVMPLLMLGFCMLYGVHGPARAVAVVAGAVPTATNAYILARQLGGHAPLMANIVTSTTIAALLTMPFMVWLLT
ncbi:MAG TPA: AEC family transporter [Rhizomicrobium sp.]|nr:AEC family transporter [Rhizomicrobium sp.]